MNILVTGANGQLGNEMQIVSCNSKESFFFTDVCDGYEKLDITNHDAVRAFVAKNNINAIVNCGSIYQRGCIGFGSGDYDHFIEAS